MRETPVRMAPLVAVAVIRVRLRAAIRRRAMTSWAISGGPIIGPIPTASPTAEARSPSGRCPTAFRRLILPVKSRCSRIAMTGWSVANVRPTIRACTKVTTGIPAAGPETPTRYRLAIPYLAMHVLRGIWNWARLVPTATSAAPHASGCNFVMCDGSVQTIPFTVDAQVHWKLANRRDGYQVNLP